MLSHLHESSNHEPVKSQEFDTKHSELLKILTQDMAKSDKSCKQ